MRHDDDIQLFLPKITIVDSNSGSSNWLTFKLSINANSTLKQIFQSYSLENLRERSKKEVVRVYSKEVGCG